ncbi:MAG: hypothetical protein WD077_10360 [Bacteroidia bacterium]
MERLSIDHKFEFMDAGSDLKFVNDKVVLGVVKRDYFLVSFDCPDLGGLTSGIYAPLFSKGLLLSLLFF